MNNLYEVELNKKVQKLKRILNEAIEYPRERVFALNGEVYVNVGPGQFKTAKEADLDLVNANTQTMGVNEFSILQNLSNDDNYRDKIIQSTNTIHLDHEPKIANVNPKTILPLLHPTTAPPTSSQSPIKPNLNPNYNDVTIPKLPPASIDSSGNLTINATTPRGQINQQAKTPVHKSQSAQKRAPVNQNARLDDPTQLAPIYQQPQQQVPVNKPTPKQVQKPEENKWPGWNDANESIQPKIYSENSILARIVELSGLR